MVLFNNHANFNSMKKYLLLFISIVAIAGCKLDEAGFPKPGENIILGKWLNKSTTTYTPAQNGQIAHTAIFNTFTADDYLLFKSTTVTMSQGFTTPAMSMQYKYVVSGSNLILTSTVDPTDTETHIVQKLTADSLVLVKNISADAGGIITTAIVTDRYARK